MFSNENRMANNLNNSKRRNYRKNFQDSSHSSEIFQINSHMPEKCVYGRRRRRWWSAHPRIIVSILTYDERRTDKALPYAKTSNYLGREARRPENAASHLEGDPSKIRSPPCLFRSSGGGRLRLPGNANWGLHFRYISKESDFFFHSTITIGLVSF